MLVCSILGGAGTKINVKRVLAVVPAVEYGDDWAMRYCRLGEKLP